MLVNVPRLVTAYFSNNPDPMVPGQRVAFGTSGHRGSTFDNSFNLYESDSPELAPRKYKAVMSGNL